MTRKDNIADGQVCVVRKAVTTESVPRRRESDLMFGRNTKIANKKVWYSTVMHMADGKERTSRVELVEDNVIEVMGHACKVFIEYADSHPAFIEYGSTKTDLMFKYKHDDHSMSNSIPYVFRGDDIDVNLELLHLRYWMGGEDPSTGDLLFREPADSRLFKLKVIDRIRERKYLAALAHIEIKGICMGSALIYRSDRREEIDALNIWVERV